MDLCDIMNARHLHTESVYLKELARTGLLQPEQTLEFESRAKRFVEDSVSFLDDLLNPPPPF